MRIDAETVYRFVDHLADRDAESATHLARCLADDGVPLTTILDDLIVPAQIIVGDRWHCGSFSVADEHAATVIVDAVVSVLTGDLPRRGGHPRIVMACAEGEWHPLPARLVAEALRADGCAVTFLGGSLPADQLGGFVAAAKPDLVAISCSTPLSLRGVLACTEAVHAAGVPVLVGGRGFGRDDRRARVLGADWWAPNASAAAQVVRRPAPTILAVASADVRGADHLAECRASLVASALAKLVPLCGTRARVAEDLHSIVQFAEAAVLTRDRSLYTEFLAWFDGLLQSRGPSSDTMPRMLGALGELVPL